VTPVTTRLHSMFSDRRGSHPENDPKTGRVLATIPAFFADGSSLPTSLKVLKFDTHGV
jgi:hypothetical protein